MAYTIPLSVLGVNVSGDLGPLTIYTDRFGKKVGYPRSPPKEPPSDLQVFYRNRFRTAQQSYMLLTPSQKLAWETLIQRTSICMTGQNLYIHIALKAAFDLLTTLQRQTGISVIAPPHI